MAEATHKKLDLAIEMLDEAIRQFLDRQQYACALNLAGAAEEVLGRTVELRGGVIPRFHGRFSYGEILVVKHFQLTPPAR